VFRRMASSGMLLRVVLERTDVSEEVISSIMRVTRIRELGTTLAVSAVKTSNLTPCFGIVFRAMRYAQHLEV
jgi:hypothetical protein